MKLKDASNGDVRKPTYFIELYNGYLEQKRESIKVVLEMGVQSGGCLAMWRDYFPNAEIHGIDIDQTAYIDRGYRTYLHVGDQADTEFLKYVISQCGSPDLVIDDGGHRMSEQITSFNTLFPLLGSGGIYVIEDIFTSYSKFDNSGWFRNMGDMTTIEYLKTMIDTLSYGYVNLEYGPGEKPSHMHIKSIHFYDCIVFIEKDNHA